MSDGTAPPTARPRPGHRRRREPGGAVPYLLIAPAMIVVICLAIVPLLYGLYLSFTDWSYLKSRSPSWSGTGAYDRLLSDTAFWTSLRRTTLWTVGTLLIELGLGLPIALLLHRRTKVTGVVSSVLLLPWITPFIVVSYAWFYLLNGRFGPLQAGLSKLGLTGDLSPLGDPDRALLIVTMISGWKGMPFMVIALLAALKAIPDEQYEAAGVDAASAWQQFKWVTLPSLRNTILVMSVALGVGAFYSFDLVFLLTKGGPGDRTQLLGIRLYQEFFTKQRPGSAAALGMIMLVVLFLSATFAMRLVRRAPR